MSEPSELGYVCERVLEGHTNWVSAVAVLGDGRVVSGGYDNTLRVWDVDTGVCERVLEGHTDAVFAVAVLGGGRVVSGSGDRTLRVWRPPVWDRVRRLLLWRHVREEEVFGDL